MQLPDPIEINQLGFHQEPVPVPLPTSPPAPQPHRIVTCHDDGLLGQIQQIQQFGLPSRITLQYRAFILRENRIVHPVVRDLGESST